MCLCECVSVSTCLFVHVCVFEHVCVHVFMRVSMCVDWGLVRNSGLQVNVNELCLHLSNELTQIINNWVQ